MKKTYWLVTFLFAFFLLSTPAMAQLDTDHAVGVRFGSSQGISYRHTLSPDRAIQGVLSTQSNSISRRFRMLALYEIYKPITGNFNWYYGFGGSVGSYKSKAFTNANGARVDSYSEAAISIDGIIGVEYNVPEAPIVISLDIKPYLDFIQSSTIKLLDPVGFTVRYKF